MTVASNYVNTSELKTQLSTQQAAYNRTSSTGTSSTASLAEDYSNFLTMLTTQLQNQDPLSPMDSTQFTQQLVAFAGVEQQITANDKLSQLISLQQTGGAATVLGYIGKEIEASGNSIQLSGDNAKYAYSLGNVASEVTITVKDANGKVVRTIEGGKAIGKHDMVWDGKDNDGDELDKGTYTFSVSAKGADGTAVKVTPYTIGTVTGIETTSKGAMLSIGGLQVDANNITAIRNTSSS